MILFLINDGIISNYYINYQQPNKAPQILRWSLDIGNRVRYLAAHTTSLLGYGIIILTYIHTGNTTHAACVT